MGKQEYHHYFDSMFNLINDKEFISNPNNFKDDHCHDSDSQGIVQMRSDNVCHKETKYTLTPMSKGYRTLQMLKILSTLYLCFFYPYLAHRQQFGDGQILKIIIIELIFLTDLIVNFFLQPLNEAGEVMRIARKDISKKYFFGRFAFDFFMIIPHGIFMIYNKSFSAFWLIKTLRMRDLIKYLSNEYNKLFVNAMVSYKQQQALQDDNLKYCIDEDYNMI